MPGLLLRHGALRQGRRGCFAAATLALAFMGCLSSEPRVPFEALDPLALTPVPAERDPIAAHRPADVDCPPAAWGPEGSGFEVQTGACAYAAFDQPLPDRIQAGDMLDIVVWHDLLDVPEPAEAHLAVWIGDAVQWETWVPMPGPSAALEARVVVRETPPEGARLGIHLHNHGFNSWRFVSVRVRPSDDAAQ